MPPQAERRFDALGTRWRLDTAVPLSDERFAAVRARIAGFDAAWSRFRPDSLVARLAADGGSAEFPPEAGALLEVYARLYRATRGAVSPLVGDALVRLGYGADYRLTPAAGPEPSPTWEDVLTVAGTRITVTRPTVLDVGAAGKGQLVDLVSALLAELGSPVHTVDASGDLRHSGPEPLRIGLEHPYDPRTAIGVVELAGGALCASAANRRVWGDGLHHVLDARTGAPVREVAATWVLADRAVDADGLATALFLAEPEQLAESFDFRYVRMFTDGVAQWSADLPGEVFAA